MKKSEILAEVIKEINKGGIENAAKNSPFICDIVNNVSGWYIDQAEEITDMIHERIGQRFCLGAWLRNVHGVSNSELYHDEHRSIPTKKFQEYRIAWVRELIKEYEAKGD